MSTKKEIEKKIRINDNSVFFALKERITSSYPLIEAVFQHDIYYAPINENYMAETYPYKWLRLRLLNDGGAEICFKHFYPEGKERHLYCDEYESAVKDPNAIMAIFSELNLQVIADVVKHRTTYQYGRYLISFDEVDNLGCFIEIEVEDVLFDEITEKELLNIVLNDLDISKYPTDLRGYPYLIYSKNID